MMRFVRGAIACLLLLGAALTFSRAADAAMHEVHIPESADEASSYNPAAIQIVQGDSVLWQNDDDRQHSVTFDDDSYEVILQASGEGGNEAEVGFADVETVSYHCKFHPSMIGSVTVGPGPTTTVTTVAPTTAAPAATTTTAKKTTTTKKKTATAAKATTTSSSLETTTSIDFLTTTSGVSTTSTTAIPFPINEENDTSNTGTILIVVVALAAILGGGAYALWRTRSLRFR